MEPQPQNPEDISRNLQIRMNLDRTEAKSEVIPQSDPHQYSLKFSEGARSDLEKMFLRVTNPEKYQKLCELIELRWEQSWQELARYNPSKLQLSISPFSRFDAHEVVLRSALSAAGKGTVVSERPPALTVLMESPAVNQDFFEAFNVTNVTSVLAWYSSLPVDKRQDLASDLERVALEVGSSKSAQVSGRYLIIPDSTDLSSPQTFLELAKFYITQKTSPTFFEHCELTVFNRKREYQERLAEMGLGEWLAHKTLDIIAAPLFAVLIKREKQREKMRALLVKCAEQFPIVKELAKDWSRAMVNPLSPADAPIREYLQLDPDAV